MSKSKQVMWVVEEVFPDHSESVCAFLTRESARDAAQALRNEEVYEDEPINVRIVKYVPEES